VLVGSRPSSQALDHVRRTDGRGNGFLSAGVTAASGRLIILAIVCTGRKIRKNSAIPIIPVQRHGRAVGECLRRVVGAAIHSRGSQGRGAASA
jgi:hypothetical protein